MLSSCVCLSVTRRYCIKISIRLYVNVSDRDTRVEMSQSIQVRKKRERAKCLWPWSCSWAARPPCAAAPSRRRPCCCDVMGRGGMSERGQRRTNNSGSAAAAATGDSDCWQWRHVVIFRRATWLQQRAARSIVTSLAYCTCSLCRDAHVLTVVQTSTKLNHLLKWGSAKGSNVYLVFQRKVSTTAGVLCIPSHDVGSINATWLFGMNDPCERKR